MNLYDGLITEVADEDEDGWGPYWSPLDFLHSGYVPARFGTLPVLLTPEFELRVRAVKAGA